jgi:Ca2+-dependent lipid-binding protein
LNSSFFFYFRKLFSNHLSGQDTLHVDVYDEDSVKNEKIGSVQIDLHPLYDTGWILLTLDL